MRLKRYWLFKTEPTVYSFDDLKLEKDKTTCWDGIRNYQARNYLRDEIKNGDMVLIYHSNCKDKGVVGIAEVVREGYVDYTAFLEGERYYDKKSDKANPRWYMVDVKWVMSFKSLVSLEAIKAKLELSDMLLVRPGQRLSIQPVSKKDFNIIKIMGAGQ